MGYLQEVDRWLDDLLVEVTEERIGVPELKRAIREKILESYRNGQKERGESPAPEPKSRSGKKRAEKPQRFTGDWQCSQCGAAITSLPFEPKGDNPEGLLCAACWRANHKPHIPRGVPAG